MNLVPVVEHGGQAAISQTDGRLAWELAAEITDVKTLLARYGMTAVDLRTKFKDRMFRQAISEAKKIWKSDMNVKQRIQIKAAFLVEDSLLDVFAIIKNENMPAASKLEAFEKLLRTADLVPRTGQQGQQAAASGFRINIHLGDSPSQQVTIDGSTLSQGALEPA